MTPAACSGTLIKAEVWEFLPQKGYLNDPIDVSVGIGENSDVVVI